MGPKSKCPECRWVGGDHAEDCLTGAEQEVENYGSEVENEPTEEWDDELEDDDD
jgi:hypothetical protein